MAAVAIRSRNYVEIVDGDFVVMVLGRQLNTSNDLLFRLPRKPGMMFPSPVYCREGGRTTRLWLLSQRKLWSPPALGRFLAHLDELGVEWERY